VASGKTACIIVKRIKRWSKAECLGVLRINRLLDYPSEKPSLYKNYKSYEARV